VPRQGDNASPACRALCKKLTDELGKDSFRETTGLPISTYFAGFKMKWMLENVAPVREAVSTGDAMFGTVDSWLIFNLTGGIEDGIHVTDGVISSTSDGPHLGCRACDFTSEFCAHVTKLAILS
jgi:glycerol kinase